MSLGAEVVVLLACLEGSGGRGGLGEGGQTGMAIVRAVAGRGSRVRVKVRTSASELVGDGTVQEQDSLRWAVRPLSISLSLRSFAESSSSASAFLRSFRSCRIAAARSFSSTKRVLHDGGGGDGMGHNGGGELREVTESLGLVATVAAVQAAVESQLAQQGAREVAEGMVEMGGSEAAAMVMARVAAVTREVAETEAVDLSVVTTGAAVMGEEVMVRLSAILVRGPGGWSTSVSTFFSVRAPM